MLLQLIREMMILELVLVRLLIELMLVQLVKPLGMILVLLPLLGAFFPSIDASSTGASGKAAGKDAPSTGNAG